LDRLTIQHNIDKLQERLEEINEQLKANYKAVADLKKDKLLPSPGLKDAIVRLETKRKTCHESLDLWTTLFNQL
jgi:uncharacterized protein Yka (UPF0111/DUF47 family)